MKFNLLESEVKKIIELTYLSMSIKREGMR